MDLENLAKLKLEAEVLTTKIHEAMLTTYEQVQSAMPLSVAKSIIKEIWGEGPQAAKMIARLSSSFPEENANVIRHQRLPDDMVKAIYCFNEKTGEYIEHAFVFILEHAKKILDILSKYSSDDVIGMEVAKGFRCECLRFIEAIRYGDFYTQDIEEMSKWADFQQNYRSNGVSDGDYMFISDFIPELQQAGKEAVREREPGETNTYSTISNVTYDCRRELCIIKLVFLFCDYLDSLKNLEEEASQE